MDIKEAERIIIAKPVASKPSSSNFGSFSELLAGAINATPSTMGLETAIPAIRPKTVRFKPLNRSSSLQGEPSGTAACSLLPENVSKPVVYKPMAKLVSKSTVSLLANLGNCHTSHQQALQQVEAYVRLPNQEKHNLRSQNISNLYQPSHMETIQTMESSKTSLQNVQEDPKPLPPSASSDRPSYDGYNWRKYGQKQVKGSEYPRSYYKCTHPNCPVKKKVERSLDGQIAEIVYKGEHNHLKPQPPNKRNSSNTQGQGFVPDEPPGQDANNALLISGSENQNDLGFSAAPPLVYHGRGSLAYDNQANAEVASTAGRTRDSSCGPSRECENVNKGLDREDVEPRSKRRRGENQSIEAGTSVDAIQEPRIVVQNSTDTEIVGDGFRWRKYGQKVVKGNPYPRSYYRCTNLKCNVRKHVERASDEPGAFVTTYEGKHNHEMPHKTVNSGASEHDSQALSSKGKQ